MSTHLSTMAAFAAKVVFILGSGIDPGEACAQCDQFTYGVRPIAHDRLDRQAAAETITRS